MAFLLQECINPHVEMIEGGDIVNIGENVLIPLQ